MVDRLFFYSKALLWAMWLSVSFYSKILTWAMVESFYFYSKVLTRAMVDRVFLLESFYVGHGWQFIFVDIFDAGLCWQFLLKTTFRIPNHLIH